ncbi:MAG TPA: glycosyltransferase family 2 protein [Solirubrobacteraceae bacterium]|nr:glycosyltransferase family 2 protein [Solirubrobacteraceae bacterium]
MSRPPVSVVMPFAGDESAAQAAVDALLALELRVGDELILSDNSGTARARGGVAVVRAAGERSPAHARNVGAAHAHGEWILFLDADCVAPRGLLDAFFAAPVADDVGALAGEVVALPSGDTLASRYGSARSFLSQQTHLNHPYRPRAVAANLLVRRAAFEQIGGFYEGVRAAEDTDFSWRLQAAGWRLELRRRAQVEHRYRGTLGELRRQWRGYAAGRAWLARRYEGFAPEPAVARAAGRLRHRTRAALGPGGSSGGSSGAQRSAPAVDAGRLERGRYLALDALLSAEELAGLALSNRPAGHRRALADVVMVADRFPARGDPLVEFVSALERVRVEAAARPELLDGNLARGFEVDYREDDGIAARVGALLALVVRHPLRVIGDLLARGPGEPGLSTLAPAVLRLRRDRRARVHALGGDEVRATARRLARLAGRPLDEPRS